MSVEVTISEAQLQKALKSMDTWSAERKRAMAMAINRVVIRVESDAKRRCPVNKKKRQGNVLRSSINGQKIPVSGNVSAKEMNAYVSTDVEYAAFVEFGTGTRGAATGANMPSDYVHGAGKKRPNSAGMAAQPYLFPAVEENRDGFRKLIKEALTK
jgi:HK97 gp10 family phage protein